MTFGLKAPEPQLVVKGVWIVLVAVASAMGFQAMMTVSTPPDVSIPPAVRESQSLMMRWRSQATEGAAAPDDVRPLDLASLQMMAHAGRRLASEAEGEGAIAKAEGEEGDVGPQQSPGPHLRGLIQAADHDGKMRWRAVFDGGSAFVGGEIAGFVVQSIDASGVVVSGAGLRLVIPAPDVRFSVKRDGS